MPIPYVTDAAELAEWLSTARPGAVAEWHRGPLTARTRHPREGELRAAVATARQAGLVTVARVDVRTGEAHYRVRRTG